MSAAEAAEFEASPYALAACQVRRWDDEATDPEAVPPFAQFGPLQQSLAR